MEINLTDDQSKAFDQIKEAIRPGDRHLLTGDAGTGKTWLMQKVARHAFERGKSIVMTAPTHKAVSVLRQKLDAAGLHFVPTRTIHALLQLRPTTVADKQVWERKKGASPVLEDIVVTDECSMLGQDLMRHMRRYLPISFVLYVGDPAQLSPVGEGASGSFDVRSRSHLGQIVRQEAGNPILEAAGIIRRSQGGPMDWTWARGAKSSTKGLFVPSDLDAWMRKAFTSQEFNEDPDAFRYLAWTNDRVAQINRRVRQWRYGDNILTPFVPGERIMLRQPVLEDDGESFIYNTNDEVDLLDLTESVFNYEAPSHGTLKSWGANIPVWLLRVNRPGDLRVVEIMMPRDMRELNRVEARLRDEAADDKHRWGDRRALIERMVKVQSVYALTVHTSQGSTFGRVFMDVPDIGRRADSNVLECQQLCYVALTRAATAVMLAL